ncbi:MAG: HAMP domain-containing protein, partial [Thermodesulfobacteriota bacterium]
MEQDSPARAGKSSKRTLSLLASMRGKLLFWFALASLFPMAVLGYLAYGRSRTALANTAFTKLAIIRDMKRQEISEFLQNAEKNLAALSRSVPGATAALTAPGSPQAQTAAQWLSACAADLSFYDLFLVSRDGKVVASARKGQEPSDNLFEGPLRDTGLAQAVRQAFSSAEIVMADMVPYAAAGNSPMAFLAQKLSRPGDKGLVLAAALSGESFETLINDSAGLEASISVSLLWPDKRMRPAGGLDPLIVEKALDGVQGVAVIRSPGGREASAAYGAVSPRAGVRWGLVVTQDQEAIYAPSESLKEITLVMALAVMAVAIGFALALASTLTRPLIRITEQAEKVAQGDLSVSAKVRSRDEIGMLAQAFNQMVARLRGLLENERGQKQYLEQTVAAY